MNANRIMFIITVHVIYVAVTPCHVSNACAYIITSRKVCTLVDYSSGSH